MIIEVAHGVTWDTEQEKQSDEAIVWLRESVLPKRDSVEPLLDAYKRPYQWTINMDTCIVTIVRKYISNNSYAMDREIITVF